MQPLICNFVLHFSFLSVTETTIRNHYVVYCTLTVTYRSNNNKKERII